MPVSVVIPTLNEERCIAGTIEQTRAAGPCEIIVVDGGSTDRTVQLAAGADRVIESPPGRGTQQNSGAKEATGDVLLFLHADCRPEPGIFKAIESTLRDPRCIGGCFRQTIEARGVGYRLLELGNSLRVKTIGWAYGDPGHLSQTQILRRSRRLSRYAVDGGSVLDETHQRPRPVPAALPPIARRRPPLVATRHHPPDAA